MSYIIPFLIPARPNCPVCWTSRLVHCSDLVSKPTLPILVYPKGNTRSSSLAECSIRYHKLVMAWILEVSTRERERESWTQCIAYRNTSRQADYWSECSLSNVLYMGIGIMHDWDLKLLYTSGMYQRTTRYQRIIVFTIIFYATQLRTTIF